MLVIFHAPSFGVSSELNHREEEQLFAAVQRHTIKFMKEAKVFKKICGAFKTVTTGAK